MYITNTLYIIILLSIYVSIIGEGLKIREGQRRVRVKEIRRAM